VSDLRLQAVLVERGSPNSLWVGYFTKQWKLTHHQFNTLAHYIHGVHDEEPVLPPALKALLLAMETRRAA